MHHVPVSLLTPLVLAVATMAQSRLVGPDVLDLSRQYHVGIYSASIGVNVGPIELLAQQGSFDFSNTGAVTGGLKTWEWSSATGFLFTPNDPVSGDFGVGPAGYVEIDFDPANPGTDLFEMFVPSDGDVLHMARYQLDSEALAVVAVAKSSGQSNASMNGTYHFYGHGMELAGSELETYADWGTGTFDGVGGVAFAGTGMEVDRFGVVTTAPFSGSANYTVAGDGALTLDNAPGGLSPSGELFFVADGSTTNPEVGMTIGVRAGASYDHNDLVGTYSLHGLSFELNIGPNAPLSVSDVGELVLTATSPTTGTWSANGITVDGSRSGQLFATLSASGTTTLANNGIMMLNFPTTGFIELAFSDSGRYAIGRVDDSYTNMFFAMRSCPCEPYGSDTAGSGGLAPELGMRSFPTLGNAGWRFAITDALGGAPAVMPIGFASSPVGVPVSGGQLWLDPLRVVVSRFLVLGGAAGVAGAGSLEVPLAIPADPSFAGVDLFAQVLVLDGAAPQTVSFSRALQVTFCR